MSYFTHSLKGRTNIKQTKKTTGRGFMRTWEKSDEILKFYVRRAHETLNSVLYFIHPLSNSRIPLYLIGTEVGTIKVCEAQSEPYEFKTKFNHFIH